MKEKKLLFLLIFLTILLSFSCKKEEITILAGPKDGNYYQAGETLKTLLEKEGNFKVKLKETQGSIENAKKLLNGKNEIGFVQYDVLFSLKLLGKLYAIAPMSMEDIHIILRKDENNIKTIDNLKTKRLSIGEKGSGSWISSKMIISYILKRETDNALFTEPTKEGLEKLLNNERDAVFYTSTQGVSLLKEIKGIKLLSLPPNYRIPSEIENIYTLNKIPKNTYPWLNTDIYVIATPFYLFASKNIKEGTVYDIAAIIFENFPKLRKKSKLWRYASIGKVKIELEEGKVMYHKGTIRYIKESSY